MYLCIYIYIMCKKHMNPLADENLSASVTARHIGSSRSAVGVRRLPGAALVPGGADVPAQGDAAGGSGSSEPPALCFFLKHV